MFVVYNVIKSFAVYWYFTLFQNISKYIPVYYTCTPVQLMCFFPTKVSYFFYLFIF